MKSSTKLFAAIAAAGVMGAGALAFAQPGMGGPGGCDGRMMGTMQRANFDPAVRADQRLTQLKTDLKLTAAQEPLWQAFADKVKAEAGKGMEAMRGTAQDLSLSAPDRMAQRTEIMKERVAVMESVNASFRQLYDSLSPDQKRVADIHAARMGQGGHRGYMGRGWPQGPAGAAVAPSKG
ncbi:MAG: Spy/CpxP family protein refolding chaperone [Rhodocyclales bacterium]|jgi:hypothetical protein|nr:Spy/CpxP family protein refolding chaperone [Rhodocyclales bacterium]